MGLRVIVLAMSIAIVFKGAHGGVRPVTLNDLTVPEDRLPTGCTLPPHPSERLDGNNVRGGLWANLPISTNPWAGTDTAVIASIRERMDPPLVPDGPPLTARESARFRMKLAEGVEAAYAAIYLQSGSDHLAVVHGLRFASAEDAVDFWRNASASKNPTIVGAAIGPIVAIVSGNGGGCFHTVGAHLKSLEK